MHGPLHIMCDQNVNGYHAGHSTFKVEPDAMEGWQRTTTTTTAITWSYVDDLKMMCL